MRDRERRALVAEHPFEAAVIGGDGAVDRVVEPPPKGMVAELATMAKQPAAHHRRQRQRHDRRGDHGNRERQREFSEHAADDAGHEQQRNEHRDQRHRQRDHGEADLLGAAQRRVERLLAVLDVADDVLDHDDGVVDHEAGADGQRHQRQIVEAEAGESTSRRRWRSSESGSATPAMMVARTVRRNRNTTITTSTTLSSRVNCTSRTDARMVAVRSCTTVSEIPGRHGALQARQLEADPPHGLDDVGAGLALDVDDHRRARADTSRRPCRFPARRRRRRRRSG